MTRDAEASALAAKYRLVRKHASGKAWLRWGAYLRSLPQSARPFDSEDLDQWALEGLLVLGGLMSNGGNVGRLAEYEALDPDTCQRYIQHSVDLHIGSRCHKAAEALRAAKRNDGQSAIYLDTPIDDKGHTLGEIHGRMETSDVALPGAAGRYPCLWLTGVMGLRDYEAWRFLGINGAEFRRQRVAEALGLYGWAIRNRRLKAGAEVPYTLPDCPYDHPDCNGVHGVQYGKAACCPGAWAARLARGAIENRKSRARAKAKVAQVAQF